MCSSDLFSSGGAEIGKEITVKFSFNDDQGFAEQVFSDQVTIVAPDPFVSGTDTYTLFNSFDDYVEGSDSDDDITLFGMAENFDEVDLGSGADLLRGQITSTAGAPSCSTVDDLLCGSHGVELGNLNASTAFTSIEKSVTNNSARLDEQAALFNCLSHIGAEIIPFYDVREKDTAGIILKWCGHFLFRVKVCGVQVTDLSWCPKIGRAHV